MEGADGWQLSNTNVLGHAAHYASLEIFKEVGMKALRKKSVLLTGFLEFLINEFNKKEKIFEILTPKEPENRGCQLSLYLLKYGRPLFDELMKRGVLGDWREPDVIRLAPVPLYNTFEEQFQFIEKLREAVEAVK